MHTLFVFLHICLLVPCLFLTFNLLSRAPRYFNFSFNYLIIISRCKFLYWIGPNFSYMVRLMDCLILLERISYFAPNLKIIFSKNAYAVCFFTYLFAFLMNTPYLFHLNLRDQSEFNASITNITILNTFTYCKREIFFSTKIGKIIVYLNIFFLYAFTLLIEVSLTIWLIYSFKKHIKEKFDLLSGPRKISLIIHTSIFKSNQIQMVKLDQNDVKINRSFKKLRRFSSRLTKISIYLSLCSILICITGTICGIVFIDDNNSITGHYISLLITIMSYFKYISNFFIFYYLNDQFKSYIYKNIILLFKRFVFFLY